jgi:hypothetical protein
MEKTLTHLFGNVLPRCCSLRTLTLDLLEHRGPQDRHLFYEEVVRCLASSSTTRVKDRFGSLSSIMVTHTPLCWPPRAALESLVLEKLVLPPSAEWDRLVSPSLVLTWCQDQQRNERFAKKLQRMGLIVPAIRQVNLDVAYRKTSPVAPHDSRTANAGVIYDSIRSFHPAFGRPTAFENPVEHISQSSVGYLIPSIVGINDQYQHHREVQWVRCLSRKATTVLTSSSEIGLSKAATFMTKSRCNIEANVHLK